MVAAADRVRDQLGAWVRTRVGGWRTLRALSVAVIPLALSPWIGRQLRKELDCPLFRDAMQAQYTAWCLRHGMKLYRDVGAPDGPFIHFLHAFVQMFVGITDAGFRRGDLVLQVAGSGAMGALLAPRFAETRAAAVLQRVAWALLSAGLWLAWYLYQGYAQTVQRDAYFALFGYLGLVLVYASATFGPRGARVAAFLGGVITTLLVASRHSGIIYPACAALGLMLANDPVREMRALRLKAAVQGAAVGLALLVLAISKFGSWPGFWFWYFRYPFTFHTWLGRNDPFKLLTEHYGPAGLFATLALVGTVAAVAVNAAPRRSLAFAFPPFLFLIAACIVGKGWINHIEQVTAAAIPLQVIALSLIWNAGAERLRWRPNHAVAAVIALLFIDYRAYQTVNESPFYGMTKPESVDPDAPGGKAVGAYLKAHTSPDDTVFLYGHECHALLDAERRTATPYYVNYLLNIEGFYRALPAQPDAQPSPSQRKAIQRLHEKIVADGCRRLTEHPPGALVFQDDSLGIFHNSIAEVTALCPAVATMIKDRYVPSDPGVPKYHVYLRKPAPP
jgi:hypothetical protein